MERYGLPNKEKTDVRWFTLDVTKWLSVPGHPPIVNPKAEDFIKVGCLLEVLPEILDGKKKGSIKIEQDKITYAVLGKSLEDLENELLSKRQLMSVTPWQFRKAINQLGHRPRVEQLIGNADQDTVDGWKVATSFQRLHPMVIQFGNVIPLTDIEIDELFELAITL